MKIFHIIPAFQLLLLSTVATNLYLSTLVHRLGLVDFYRRLHRGLKSVFLDPYIPLSPLEDYYDTENIVEETQRYPDYSSFNTGPETEFPSTTPNPKGLLYYMTPPNLATTLPPTSISHLPTRRAESYLDVIGNYSSVQTSPGFFNSSIVTVYGIPIKPTSEFYFTTGKTINSQKWLCNSTTNHVCLQYHHQVH